MKPKGPFLVLSPITCDQQQQQQQQKESQARVIYRVVYKKPHHDKPLARMPRRSRVSDKKIKNLRSPGLVLSCRGPAMLVPPTQHHH